jgi:hypothetical protein
MMIIFRCIFSKWIGERIMDWIDLTQDSERWEALDNAVMKLGFHKM